jgi:prefoldin subunit 5
MTNASDRELLELIAAQVGKLTGQIDSLTTRVDGLASEMQKLHESQVRIENNHGEKLAALFDFQKTQVEVNKQVLSTLDCIDNRLGSVEKVVSSHSDKLDRLEKESLKHTDQLQRIENKLETHDTQIYALQRKNG